ncbi:hypothetical protein [Croceimicrobium sp.]|uniref:hypothetical protein n=1 Tax=Croceimicrobium sp. TaxID=2828340 RepID=UPI003BAAFD63
MKKWKLIGLIIFLQACSADKSYDLKAPQSLIFAADVNREGGKLDRLFFEGGLLRISRFQLDGDRVEAEDYFFQNGYSPAMEIPLDSLAYPRLQFDLPQGIYNSIRLQFEIPSANIPTLIVLGRFQDSTGLWVPLRLEVDSFELFSLLALDQFGDQEIVIEEGNSYYGLLRLNPQHWFSGVRTEQLEAAQRISIGGESTLLINRSVNSEIFTEVDNRLDELNDLTIY